MPYHFEELGDERFQQLCQAILTCVFPNVQCLPVSQPDGGRDAFLRRPITEELRGNEKSHGFIIYQVKYVRDPQSRRARDEVEQVVKSEKDKVENLVRRHGATEYYLLTNVKGSSHLDTGSVDKVNAALEAAFAIPSYCWWRDDLERRIDTFANIKWSYPDIIRATDLLQALLENGTGHEMVRRTDALRAYMAYQFKYDAQLKFKQIELQKSIIDLFVDVPARMSMSSDPEVRARWQRTLDPRLYEILGMDSSHIAPGDDIAERILSNAPGAAQLLARADVARALPRVVIEGAPGQGKSTITQYLCQIHRMLLQPSLTSLSRIPKEHRPSEARIPFRIDVRDYASWLAGRDPFSDDPSARLPADSIPVLESFLAAQVHRYTGRSFSVDDLSAVARSSQLLIVLDGFDEVADIPSRNRLVAEISDATTRLEANATSLQIIVTSRPAAFANSPGFSREEWQHIQILSLSHSGIIEYTKKWLDARGADPRERREITGVLQEKLTQPHVRDLARNPMQLAILLALISVQGASLPDKRTALYDKYIDIFFNRESEKSSIVRDHRDLLIHIHRYLAWTLQVEAEENSSSGNISEVRLRDLLRTYLDQTGHDIRLVDELFTGLRERVGALVSRVQGTFEFEVQPLREYFAARHLYDTAPYSPAGAPRHGTRPQRFVTIARNFYWLNVTRFYAGCYSSGELASLLEGLEELESSEQFKYISHIRQIGIMLLSDYVFSQLPRLAEKLIFSVIAEPGFRVLLANSHRDHAGIGLQLPLNCGRAQVVDICQRILSKQMQNDTLDIIARTLIANCTSNELQDYWKTLRPIIANDRRWVLIGTRLGVIEQLPIDQCIALLNEIGESFLRALINANRSDVFASESGLWNRVVEYILDRSLPYLLRHRPEAKTRGTDMAMLVSQFSVLFTPYFWSEIETAPDEIPVRHSFRRLTPFPFRGQSLTALAADWSDAESIFPHNYRAILDDLFDLEIKAWKGSIAPWSRLIEETRAIWGDKWVLYRTAVAAAIIAKVEAPEKCELTDQRVPLCERVAYARLVADNTAWWCDQLYKASKVDMLAMQFLLFALHSLMPIHTVITLSPDISTALDSLPDVRWSELAAASTNSFLYHVRRSPSPKPNVTNVDLPPVMSPRLACLLIHRLAPEAGRAVYDRYLASYKGDDPSILTSCIEVVIGQASEEAEAWAKALPIIASAYKRNLMMPRSPARPSYVIPIPEARRICSNAMDYPLSVIADAEAVLATQTGAEAIPVGKIAAMEQWFANI